MNIVAYSNSSKENPEPRARTERKSRKTPAGGAWNILDLVLLDVLSNSSSEYPAGTVSLSVAYMSVYSQWIWNSGYQMGHTGIPTITACMNRVTQKF